MRLGLFHRVLNQGGSALGLWAIDETIGVGDSKRVAELAGCSQPELVDLIGCVETKPVNTVIDAYLSYAVIILPLFGPRISSGNCGAYFLLRQSSAQLACWAPEAPCLSFKKRERATWRSSRRALFPSCTIRPTRRDLCSPESISMRESLHLIVIRTGNVSQKG